MPHVSLIFILINSQGYDKSGYYWGVGLPLYRADHDDWDYPMYTRADNREHAKEIVLRQHPDATFYR